MIIDDYAMEYVLIKWVVRFFSKLNWSELSSNPNAVHLLENNLDKINWSRLSRNPSIFRKHYPIKESDYSNTNT